MQVVRELSLSVLSAQACIILANGCCFNKRPLKKEGKGFKLLPKHEFWRGLSLGAENNSFLLLQIIFLHLQNSLPIAQGLKNMKCGDPVKGQPRRLWWLASQFHAINWTLPSLQDFCLGFYSLSAVKTNFI